MVSRSRVPDIQAISCRKNDTTQVVITGREFIDASYTGDLMAMAKVSYLLGSESCNQYGESLGRDIPGPQIQAFNYRVTITKDPGNRVSIERPPNYDPSTYNRFVGEWSKQTFPTPQCWFQYHLPNQKLDSNFSDMPGSNWGYPDTGSGRKIELEAVQRDYSLGFFHFLQNDTRLPEAIRKANLEWGLCKDEFTDNGHFPLKFTCAKRVDSTEPMSCVSRMLRQNRLKEDSIAIGSLSLDCQCDPAADPELPTRAPRLRPDGGLMAPVRPYDIPYRGSSLGARSASTSSFRYALELLTSHGLPFAWNLF